MMRSPYKKNCNKDWLAITKDLVEKHPLESEEIVDVILLCWNSITNLKFNLNDEEIFVGKEIFPKPQILGFFLHEFIPIVLSNRYPNKWRLDKSKEDKDLVYIPNDIYSIEIKTSSSAKKIYGNRSYAQKSSNNKKSKSGYYITINFEKFSDNNTSPKITIIRFGWIDESDWKGQKANTGQQSHLGSEVYDKKLITLYSVV